MRTKRALNVNARLWKLSCPAPLTPNLSLSDIMTCFFLFQILSVQQLYRICVLYKDDNYNTRSVSPDVSLFVGISSVMRMILNLVKWIWLLSNLIPTLSTGHLQHEGTYDRGLQWCREQFLLVGWQFWVRVLFFIFLRLFCGILKIVDP